MLGSFFLYYVGIDFYVNKIKSFVGNWFGKVFENGKVVKNI